FGQQLTRAHGEVDALPCDRINEACRITRQRPARAGQAQVTPIRQRERGQQVTKDRPRVDGVAEILREAEQALAKLPHLDLAYFAANPQRQVVRAREGPGVALKAFEKLHAKKMSHARRVTTEGQHKVA